MGEFILDHSWTKHQQHSRVGGMGRKALGFGKLELPNASLGPKLNFVPDTLLTAFSQIHYH